MTEWTRFCRTKQFVVDASSVRVRFRSGRTQRVRVHEQGDVLRLESTVLGRAAVETLIQHGGTNAREALGLRLMQRNRSAPLVGFRITPEGKIVAESMVPRYLGLNREEFRIHLMHVATEADRLEQLLTGEDRN